MSSLLIALMCPVPPYTHAHTHKHAHTQIGTAAFIDAEHALDPVYAKNLGVNVDDLLVCQVGSAY
jgi:RecA/RadA recombinase